MINEPLVREIQAAIRAEPQSLNMSHFCGTARCIAGWAVFLKDRPVYDAAKRNPDRPYFWSLEAHRNLVRRAAELLGLGPVEFDSRIENSYPVNNETANVLFFGNYEGDDLPYLNADHAIACLDHLVEHGTPFWPEVYDA